MSQKQLAGSHKWNDSWDSHEWQAAVRPVAGPELATQQQFKPWWQRTTVANCWQAGTSSGEATHTVLTMREQLGKVKTLEAKLKQLELDAEVHELEAQKKA